MTGAPRPQGKGRLAWLVTGAVVTVTLIATASFSLWYVTSFNQKIHYQTQAQSYTGRPASLTIRLDSGNITLTTGPAGRIEVTRALGWSGAKPSIDERWDGRALSIEQHCPGSVLSRTCAVGYTIAAPPGVTVTATTDSGTIGATGLDGALRLTSLAGDVIVNRARSAVVLASSDAGDVRLGFAAAPVFVQAQTAAGNVSVRVPRGVTYTVLPVADAGTIRDSVSSTPTAQRSISATSDSGDVTVVYNLVRGQYAPD